LALKRSASAIIQATLSFGAALSQLAPASSEPSAAHFLALSGTSSTQLDSMPSMEP